MTQLSEVRDTMIKEIIVQVPVEEVTESFIKSFNEQVKASKGPVTLRMKVYDKETGVYLSLFSKSNKVMITSQFIDYLEKNNITFNIK